MEDRLDIYELDDILVDGIFLEKDFVCELFSFGEDCGAAGNLWQYYLSYRMITDDNPYNLAAENGFSGGTLRKFALKDIELIFDYFDNSFLINNCQFYEDIINFIPMNIKPAAWSERVVSLAENIASAQNAEDMLDIITEDIAEYGSGELSLYQAFRFSRFKETLSVDNIKNPDRRGFNNLIGFENQKKALIENTEAFVSGGKYNNVLLYGDAGAGKSSSIKALLPLFSHKKLKIIEVYKNRYTDVPYLITKLSERGFKIILYLDDLSFDEFETEYKELKAFLDGGLERRPTNIAVYATSNRSKLIKENFSDRKDMVHDGDIHRSETIEEKHSLSARFGLSIYYPTPNEDEFINILSTMAIRSKLNIEKADLLSEWKKWNTENGKKTGRMAEQFINHLLGTVIND